jgi:hypothetical protein
MASEQEEAAAELARLGSEIPNAQTSSAATEMPILGAGILNQIQGGLRNLGSLGANIAGAGVGAKSGAAAGVPFVPFTAGLSVPVGAILGGALGGYGADVVYNVAADVAEGKSPLEGQNLQAIQQKAAEEAAMGAGIETGVRAAGALLPPSIRAGTQALAWGGKKLRNALGPRAVEGANDMAAEVLTKLGVTKEGIATGLQSTSLPNPTLFQATKDPLVGAVETELSKSKVGAQTFLEKEAKQAKQIESEIKALAPKGLQNKTELKLGQTLQRKFRESRKQTYDALSSEYTPELLNTKITLGDLDKKVNGYLKAKFGEQVPSIVESYANKIKGLYPSEGASSIILSPSQKDLLKETAKNEIPLKEIQTIRSEILNAARKSSNRATQKHLGELANQLTAVVDEAPKVGAELKKINGKYKEYVDLYFNGPLADSVMGKTGKVKPEKVFDRLTNNAQAMPEFEQVFGKVEAVKGKPKITGGMLLMAGKLREFNQLTTDQAKRNWVQKNENLLEQTELWPRFQKYLGTQTEKQTLQNIASGGAKEKVLGRQLREEAIQQAELPSSVQSAILTRPGVAKPEGVLGQTLVAVMGGRKAAATMEAGKKLAAGYPAKGTARIGATLTKAFENPSFAMRLLDEKAARDAARQAALPAERELMQQQMRLFLTQPSQLGTIGAQTYANLQGMQPLNEGVQTQYNIATGLDEEKAEAAEELRKRGVQ